MASARDSLAAAEWIRLVASPGGELESAAEAALSVPGGDAARRQIALQLLGWSRGLAGVERLARDPAEASDLRTRRRRLAAAAAVTARGLDGWQTVQHAAKLDRWPSKWLLEARAAQLLQRLKEGDGLSGQARDAIAVVPGLGDVFGGPLAKPRAELERLRRQPDDLVFVQGAWTAPAREGLLTLIRTLGGADATDDEILKSTLSTVAVASDGASRSQASDLGPRVERGDYSATEAARQAAAEAAKAAADAAGRGLEITTDLGKTLGVAGLLLGALVLLSSSRGGRE